MIKRISAFSAPQDIPHDAHRISFPHILFDKYGIDFQINPPTEFVETSDILSNSAIHPTRPEYEVVSKYFCKKITLAHVGDDLESLKPEHRKHSRKIRREIYKCAKEHDALIVTTEYLKKKMKFLGMKIYVFPNCVVPELYKGLESNRTDDKIRILYCGSTSHKSDLNSISRALHSVFLRYSKVVMCVFGLEPECLYTEVFDDRLFVRKFVDFLEYHKILRLFSPDIAVVPLTLQEFNRSRTALKWTEMAASGAAMVISKHPVFDEVAIPDENCLVAKDEQEWVKHLSTLIEDVDERKRLAKNAYDSIVKDWSVESMTPRYVELYNRIYSELGR